MSICPSFRAFHPSTTHKFSVNKSIRFSARFISITPYYCPSPSPNKSPKPISSVSPVSLQSVGELPPKLQTIVRLFETVKDPRTKYEQLLFYGKKLSPFREEFRTPENKVQGCVSQVWVRAFLDEGRQNIFFEADSDSALTKGLAALLVEAFSGNPPSEIIRVPPDFIQLLGLQQSLTPSRNNGFLNMLKLMQRQALELFMEAQGKSTASPARNSQTTDVPAVGDDNEVLDSELDEDYDEDEVCFLARASRIKEILNSGLDPVELVVEDCSHLHAGHLGGENDDGETHFNVKIVAKDFEGKSLIKRHRLVYDLLQQEFENGLHALSIEAKTPSEIGGVAFTSFYIRLETDDKRSKDIINSSRSSPRKI